jgi:histone H3/H4
MKSGRPVSKTKTRIVNRARLHRLLQQEVAMASPAATRFLSEGLERIARHLARRSGGIAAIARRQTIKQTDVERAWNEFIQPRQAITRTANELADLIDRLHARGDNAGGNLPPEVRTDTATEK